MVDNSKYVPSQFEMIQKNGSRFYQCKKCSTISHELWDGEELHTWIGDHNKICEKTKVMIKELNDLLCEEIDEKYKKLGQAMAEGTYRMININASISDQTGI